MSPTPFWILPFLLALGVVDPIPLYRVIREIEDYQNIEAAYTNYTANEVCFSEMHVYQRGDVVPNAGPCEECRCEPPSIVCQMTKCPVNSNGCRTIQKPNHCCPDYNCDCEYGDRVYNDGARIDTPGECQVCYCKGGEVMCTTIACYTRDDCEPTHVPGQCCPVYQNCPVRDPNGSNGEDKALPKREMQPWLLTKMESHTAPQVALTSSPSKDLSTPSTGQAETSLAEIQAVSHRDNEGTSTKPMNVLDEVVFTRVDKNSSSAKLNQEHSSEPKTADQIIANDEVSTTEDIETTTNPAYLTTTEALLEDFTEKLGHMDLSDISPTIFSEKVNPTEKSETKAAKIVEEMLFSTTSRLDEDVPTTVQTLAHIKSSVDEEAGTTEIVLESTTNNDMLAKDVSQDLIAKDKHESDVAEKFQNEHEIVVLNEKQDQDPNFSTTSSIEEEDTFVPTTPTETEKPTIMDRFLTTKVHAEHLFEHSTDNSGRFVINDNSLEEPKHSLAVGKKEIDEEFSPLIVTNSVEYLTTLPSVSKHSDLLNHQDKLKASPLGYETTQRDEFSTVDFTTVTSSLHKDSLSELELNTLEEKQNTNQHSKSEAEDMSESANNSNILKIIENTTDKASKAREDVETSGSHPVEVEIISQDGDEVSTRRILLDSDEDGDPVVIDIVHDDDSRENADEDRNVPPILELNSNVPFLQLGEDSSEETTEVVSRSTSDSPSKPEKLLHVNSSLVSSNDQKKDEISEDVTTTVSSNSSEDHISSTPVIPLTPGDLKVLAEFMIKEKIKPVDEKNNSLYRPNRWLEGNLTSEEKIASIMSAASVTVGLMNRTGSEKSIVPLEALKNKSNISNLSESKKTETNANILPSNLSQNSSKIESPSEFVNISKIDNPKIKDISTTAGTLALASSGPAEDVQVTSKMAKAKEFVTSKVTTPVVSERLTDVKAKEADVLKSTMRQPNLLDNKPKEDESQTNNLRRNL